MQFAVIDLHRVQELFGQYTDALSDPTGETWVSQVAGEAGGVPLPLELRRANGSLDAGDWERFLGHELGDAGLAISTEGLGQQVTTLRFATLDVRAALESVGWQRSGAGHLVEDERALVVDQRTVRFGPSTPTAVLTDSAGVGELLDALDDTGVHLGVAVIAPVPFANPDDDPLPRRLAELVGVRGKGSSVEALTIASYADESEADAAATAVVGRIEALESDHGYAGSRVSVEGRVVVIVTPAPDSARTWAALRNRLLTVALLD